MIPSSFQIPDLVATTVLLFYYQRLDTSTKFEPVLNVGEDTTLNMSPYKCTLDSELGFLGLLRDRKFACVDMKTKKGVLKLDRYGGYHTFHWVVSEGRKCLSLQTKNNEIKLCHVDAVKKTFTEDESLRMTLSAEEHIFFSAFFNVVSVSQIF